MMTRPLAQNAARLFFRIFLLCLFPCAAQAQTAEASDGASVLVYNLYTANPTMPSSENTRLSITNTSATASVAVHLFFVANDCKAIDQFIALTANQTLVILASEIDPGVRGYLIAIAVGSLTGCPIKFNHLIGEAAIKLATGPRAVLTAEGIQALRDDPAACDAAATAAELRFDGVRYGVLPRVLAVDSIGSRLDGNASFIVINRLGGDLRERAATTGLLFGLLYDDAESAYSFSLTGGCQVMKAFPPTRYPRAPIEIIRQGQTGWAKIYNNSLAVPILGAVLSFNSNERDQPSSFSGGRNMHHLTATNTGTLTIPVMPPN